MPLWDQGESFCRSREIRRLSIAGHFPTGPLGIKHGKRREIPGKLTGAKRREWMGMGVAGIIMDNYCGSFPKIPYV